MSVLKNSKVYALILNYNSSQETVELYHNILEGSYNEIALIVIDNLSENADREYLKKHIPISNLILNEKNLGFAAGNNVGIKHALKAGADYVWILNPDIRLEKDSLSILVDTLKSDDKLAAVGPRILKREAPDRVFSDGEKMVMNEKADTFHKNHNLEVKNLPKGIDYNIDYIAGSSMLLRTKAIKEIGTLPEDYFLYFEETDWCFKAKQCNWKLAINSNSIVYNITSAKTSVFHYYFMRNRLIFCKKYHPDFKSVRNYQVREIIGEIISRVKGKYFRPFFKARATGLISGIIKTSF